MVEKNVTASRIFERQSWFRNSWDADNIVTKNILYLSSFMCAEKKLQFNLLLAHTTDPTIGLLILFFCSTNLTYNKKKSGKTTRCF